MRVQCALLFVGLTFLSGCAYSIHQVHTSDFVPYAKIEQGEMVKGRGEQFVVLGITGETDYVDKAYAELMKNCPHGAVTGITTQLSTKLNFFSWTNVALMQGLCVQTRKN